jgi:hypothetical protein
MLLPIPVPSEIYESQEMALVDFGKRRRNRRGHDTQPDVSSGQIEFGGGRR